MGMRMLSVLIVLALLVFPSVVGIGISPAKISFTLYPGEERDVVLTGFSNEQVEQVATLTLKPWLGSEDAVPPPGQLSLLKYLVLDRSNIPLSPGEKTDLKITAKYPTEPILPGNYEYQLHLVQGKPAKDGFIVALGAVRVPINVVLKAKGKSALGSLSVLQITPEGLPLNLHVNNWGDEPIEVVHGTIDIFDGPEMKEKLATIDMGSAPLPLDSNINLQGIWKVASSAKGSYWASATIEYDGLSAVTNRSIRVGTLTVKVVDTTPELTVGSGVLPFNLNLQNEWSAPLENIFADISIKQGSEVLLTMTASEKRITGLGKVALKTFADTSRLRPGLLDLEAIITFSEEGSAQKHSFTHTGTINVLPAKSSGSVSQSEAPVSEQPSGIVSNEKKSGGNMMVIVLVGLVLGISLLVLVLVRRKKDEYY